MDPTHYDLQTNTRFELLRNVHARIFRHSLLSYTPSICKVVEGVVGRGRQLLAVPHGMGLEWQTTSPVLCGPTWYFLSIITNPLRTQSSADLLPAVSKKKGMLLATFSENRKHPGLSFRSGAPDKQIVTQFLQQRTCIVVYMECKAGGLYRLVQLQ